MRLGGVKHHHHPSIKPRYWLLAAQNINAVYFFQLTLNIGDDWFFLGRVFFLVHKKESLAGEALAITITCAVT